MLEIKNLVKKYVSKKGTVVKALDDVSIRFPSKGMVFILGKSGSGKSTAAKLMLRAHLRNNYQVVVIDPEGELEDMSKLYGGDFIDLNTDRSKSIDIMLTYKEQGS